MVTLGLARNPVDGTLTDVDRPHHRDRQGGSSKAKLPENPPVGRVTRGGIEKVPRPNGRPPTTGTDN